jgi:tartrate dehydrogenase/decarboxylase/D-malate dehydrogenase
MNKYEISVIEGDGIGKEVIPAAIEVLTAISKKYDFELNWKKYPWGSDFYLKTGKMMPDDGLEQLSSSQAVFLGAVGTPEIPDDVTLWGLLIPIRRGFDQYINLRPMTSFEGVQSPLVNGKNIDLVVVRENVEGEYSTVGGRYYDKTPFAGAIQSAIFTRRGVERVTRYAQDLAVSRRKNLVSATKSNGITHSMPFWDEVVREILAETPQVKLRSVLIDALAAALVLNPQSFDVIVASNLFGDILSDLTAALVGSIGIAPSANINPEKLFPSMFEPVHGSAPDIAGKGIANPCGAIWAGSLMLNHLGEVKSAEALMQQMKRLIAQGKTTPDLGGSETTVSFKAQLIELIDQLP